MQRRSTFKLFFLLLLLLVKLSNNEGAYGASVQRLLPTKTNRSQEMLPNPNHHKSHTTAPDSVVQQSLGDSNRFKLLDQQCSYIDEVFEQTKLNWAIFEESCQSRFIKIIRLYNNNLLVYISVASLTTDSNNSMVVELNQIQKRVRLIYSKAQFVIRAKKCYYSNHVLVQVTPPPPQFPNGTVLVPIVDRAKGIGELLIHASRLPDMWEVQFGESTNSQCSLIDSYLVLCIPNRFSACEVKVVTGEDFKLECDCAKSSPSYLHHINCTVLFMLLIIISVTNFKELKEDLGYDQENVDVILSSHDRDKAYYYKVLYRVGCPTFTFDCKNTTIDFELLGPNMEPVCRQVRFALVNTRANNQMNTFTCHLFVPCPLPPLTGVRVAHQGGFPGSAIFLFDVTVNFISGPEKSHSNEERKDKEYVIKPVMVNLSSITNQRLCIYSYILDYTMVYTKLPNQDTFDMPFFTYPELSTGFIKLLAWLVAAQAVLLSVMTLCFDQFYSKFQIIILPAIGVAMVISLITLLELAFIVWIHKILKLKSMLHQLRYGCNQENNSNCNWANCANFFLVAILLVALAFLITENVLMLKQPKVLALHVESISILVFVVVGGICWLCYADRNTVLTQDRLMVEYQLMSESNLRGQSQWASLSEESEEASVNNNASNQSASVGSGVHQSKSLSKGSFEMFSE